MTLIFKDGALLFDGGQLAMSTDCCCDEGGPTGSCCTGPLPTTLTLATSGWSRTGGFLSDCLTDANGVFVLDYVGQDISGENSEYQSAVFCVGDSNANGYRWTVTLCTTAGTGSGAKIMLRIIALPSALEYQDVEVWSVTACNSFTHNFSPNFSSTWTVGTASVTT